MCVCSRYSNLVKQAQSKQKIIDKMIESGLTPKPLDPIQYRFKWPSCAQLPPPVMAFDDVSFSYSGEYKINFQRNFTRLCPSFDLLLCVSIFQNV